MEKGHVVSVEMQGKDAVKTMKGKIVQHVGDTVIVMVGDMVKLEFKHPSGEQVMTGVKSDTRGFCRISSWEGL